MTILSPHLAFEGDNTLPPAGSHLVISDMLSASSNFTLYHLVIAAIQRKVPVIWIDLRAEGRASWDAVLRRLGTPLPRSAPSFTHITPSALPPTAASSSPPLFTSSGTPDLQPTYAALIAALAALPAPAAGAQAEPTALILLDGLSTLTSLGVPACTTTRLVRAALAAARTSNAALVTTLHADALPLTPDAPGESTGRPAGEDAALLYAGLRVADVWWRVCGLATGRSGDVSGEVSVHVLRGRGVGVPRSQPLQYRLEPGGVKVFAKGTGRGFL